MRAKVQHKSQRTKLRSPHPAGMFGAMLKAALSPGSGGVGGGDPVPGSKAALSFSIITPSYRNSEWLRLCVASIADQQGVELEHIVQDSCSDDGTQDWLPKHPRVKAFIEKDK